ncbi:MAG: ion channel, partial [Gammaproteobacteria bacterium]|nr:ion channel [Gammaproteobacteria bacterium]
MDARAGGGARVSNVTSLVFRRMRAPLLVLIGAYAAAILGFVLIPGVDDAGRPWRMDFFHALYFVSYMSTTIGFGELPHPFTDAQRLWTTVTIYLSVTAWLY